MFACRTSEFGLVSTAPSCSTFHSPQLGAQVSQSSKPSFLYLFIRLIYLFISWSVSQPASQSVIITNFSKKKFLL